LEYLILRSRTHPNRPSESEAVVNGAKSGGVSKDETG
jgi:hypothetical protein